MRHVVVTWNDAYDIGGWISPGKCKRNTDGAGVFAITSGFVVEDSDKKMVISQTWIPDEEDEDDESLRNIMVIPRGCVIEVIEFPLDIHREE